MRDGVIEMERKGLVLRLGAFGWAVSVGVVEGFDSWDGGGCSGIGFGQGKNFLGSGFLGGVGSGGEVVVGVVVVWGGGSERGEERDGWNQSFSSKRAVSSSIIGNCKCPGEKA